MRRCILIFHSPATAHRPPSSRSHLGIGTTTTSLLAISSCPCMNAMWWSEPHHFVFIPSTNSSSLLPLQLLLLPAIKWNKSKNAIKMLAASRFALKLHYNCRGWGAVVAIFVAFITAIVSALFLPKWNPISRLQGLPTNDCQQQQQNSNNDIARRYEEKWSSPRDFFQSPFHCQVVCVCFCVPCQLNMQ